MPAQAHASNKILQTAARIALLGLLINVVLASVKIVAGVIGHAYVLIADGIESALDIGGSIVIWGGLTVAARPPDETHPYGHGKAEPIAAIAVALGGKIVRSIRAVAISVPGVVEVEKCRARKMGLDYYVDLHVGVDGNISVHEGHQIAHRVKSAIQRSDSRIADVLVHIEPAA